MHNSALFNVKSFFNSYCNSKDVDVIEIGSYDVNGSARTCVTPNVKKYLGVDFNPGPGVDLVLTDPYSIPVEDNTYDALITTSCFEHSELFWLTFLEALRVVKPNGLVYVNAPGAWMPYHRYPVDAWRFYPDSGRALEVWGNRNNIPCVLLESYASVPSAAGECSDQVMVFLKDKQFLEQNKNRILDNLEPYKHFVNAFRYPLNEKFIHGYEYPNFSASLGPDYFHN